MFHLNTFTLLLIVVGLCALASMLARILPKRGTRIEEPAAPKADATDPEKYAEYRDYLKHKYLAEKYDKEEPFTWSKFVRGFITGKNYAKAIVLGIIMLVLVFLGYSAYKEISGLFVKTPPVVSTISNTGGGTVESKTESKSEHKQSNGLNLNVFSGWF